MADTLQFFTLCARNSVKRVIKEHEYQIFAASVVSSHYGNKQGPEIRLRSQSKQFKEF